MVPQITVIIPAYRRRDYLFFALDRILAQKDVTMEILVYSEVMEADEVDEVEKAYPMVKYFKTDEYKGASNKRRAGIKMAQGKYLYMPDDDDYLIDDSFFSKAVKILDSSMSLSMVAGGTIIKHEYKEHKKDYEEKLPFNLNGRVKGIDYLQQLQAWSKPMSSVSIIFRKQMFIDRNYESMFEISDMAMYMNALVWGDAYILPESSAMYRLHENNLSYHLSFPFIFNVIREKDRIFRDSKEKLLNPDAFWNEHYRITYLFYKNGDATLNGKLKMLLWGLRHNYGVISLAKFMLKEIVKCFIGK